MTIHIGIIIDKSYFKPYEYIKDGKIYLYKICPYCEEKVELGFGTLSERGKFATTLPHRCKHWADEARRQNGYIDYLLQENGFVFKNPELLKEPK